MAGILQGGRLGAGKTFLGLLLLLVVPFFARVFWHVDTVLGVVFVVVGVAVVGGVLMGVPWLRFRESYVNSW